MATSSAAGCSHKWIWPAAILRCGGRGGVAPRSRSTAWCFEPVLVGDEVSCYGEIIRTGRSSITTRIEAWRRNLASGEVRKVTQAIFTYVAIGADRRPRRLPPND